MISVEGTAAPSAIVQAIQGTGRDAILRGSGASGSQALLSFHRQTGPIANATGLGAAVCILETHSTKVPDKVRGLVRMVQVTPTMTIIDLTIRGLSPGSYHTTIREKGDISQGAASTGGIWEALKVGEGSRPARGVFGTIEVTKGGIGAIFTDKPIQIWEMIGRSIVVSKKQDGRFEKEDPDTLVGVIARSAGVWDNDRTVCSCSGKTVWEERKEQIGKGMI